MKDISQFQNVLLEVYKEFASFCEQNNITFFAAYGTMIGAIRHHGFIPWPRYKSHSIEERITSNFHSGLLEEIKYDPVNMKSNKVIDFSKNSY